MRARVCVIWYLFEIFIALQRRLVAIKLTWGPAESDESWRRRRAHLSRRWSCFARLHPDNRRLSDGTKAPVLSYRVSRPLCLRLPFSSFTLATDSSEHLSFTRLALPRPLYYYCNFFNNTSLASEKEKQIFACKFATIMCNIIRYINEMIRTLRYTLRLIPNYPPVTYVYINKSETFPEISRECLQLRLSRLDNVKRKEREEKRVKKKRRKKWSVAANRWRRSEWSSMRFVVTVCGAAHEDCR